MLDNPKELTPAATSVGVFFLSKNKRNRVSSLEDSRLQDSMTWENTLEAFLTFKEAQELRPRSIQDYQEKMSQIFRRF